MIEKGGGEVAVVGWVKGGVVTSDKLHTVADITSLM
jgi:NAD(P)H-nitrite reductase large subunit